MTKAAEAGDQERDKWAAVPCWSVGQDAEDLVYLFLLAAKNHSF